MSYLIRYREPQTPANWTPFNRHSSLHDQLERLFDWPFRGLLTPESAAFNGWSPSLDVYQDEDNVHVTCELPGLKKEDIEITLHEGVLTISGERKREEQSKEGEAFRKERFYGKFQRSVSLPTRVDEKKVTAAYNDGILTITLAKAEEAKARRIDVEVKG